MLCLSGHFYSLQPAGEAEDCLDDFFSVRCFGNNRLQIPFDYGMIRKITEIAIVQMAVADLTDKRSDMAYEEDSDADHRRHHCR